MIAHHYAEMRRGGGGEGEIIVKMIGRASWSEQSGSNALEKINDNHGIGQEVSGGERKRNQTGLN